MVSRLPSVPSWLVGVWERRWIVRGRGARDADVTVRYVQAPDAFVDVRASAGVSCVSSYISRSWST